jgi:hypothetical protein
MGQCRPYMFNRPSVKSGVSDRAVGRLLCRPRSIRIDLGRGRRLSLASGLSVVIGVQPLEYGLESEQARQGNHDEHGGETELPGQLDGLACEEQEGRGHA